MGRRNRSNNKRFYSAFVAALFAMGRLDYLLRLILRLSGGLLAALRILGLYFAAPGLPFLTCPFYSGFVFGTTISMDVTLIIAMFFSDLILSALWILYQFSILTVNMISGLCGSGYWLIGIPAFPLGDKESEVVNLA